MAVLLLLSLFAPGLAQASASDEIAIRETLAAWTTRFNAGDMETICELFLRELRYDFRGHPERGFDEICALLRRSLSDRTRKYSYSLEIKEILVSGDLAVVRLVWKLEVRSPQSAKPTVSVEPGMDVFRKQPDGSWKIIRYLAYED